MGERLTTLLPRLGWGAVVAAAALVPVAYTRALADPFSLPKATVWWIAAILAAAGLAADAASRRSWPVPRLRAALPLGILVGWTVLATALSPQPLVSLLGQYGRYDGLASLLCGAVLALAMVAFAGREPARLVAVAWAVLAGGAVSLVVVVGQGLGWAWTGWGGPERAPDLIVGLVGNGNFSGALLALVVPFALGLRSHVPQPGVRIGLLAGAVALAGGVVWTGTRGGVLALLAGVAAFGALTPELLPKVLRIGVTAALVVGFAAIGVSSVSDVLADAAPQRLEAQLVPSSLRQRQNIWTGAGAMIRESPIVGVGPDAFALRFPEVRSSRADGLFLIDADEAHNVYLDRGATAGLPALAAYLWLVGTVAVTAWRRRRSVVPEHRWLLAAFGGAFAGYLVQGVFSIDMVPLAVLSWLALGGLLVLTDPAVEARRTGEEPEPAARPVPVGALVGLFAAVAVALVLAVRPVLADRHARAGQLAEAADEPLEAYGEFATASSWLDHEPRYHQRQAAALVAAAVADDADPGLRTTLLDEAIIGYDHALDRAPGDVPLRQAQAQVHVLAAEAAADTDVAAAHLDEAIGAYRDLMASVRATDGLHLALGRAYEARAGLESGDGSDRDLALAAEQYQLARAYRPDRVEAALALARLAVDEGELDEARQVLVDAHEETGDERLDAAIDAVDRRIGSGS
ncbi:MAG TPA: O-antigen ligase family protein [Acidimicrobiales bacterium]|nr:O-antigen ligase family protein [Acidimicrobiales bacterium]